ncbi:MAG: 1-acyl-sn-glycerol-3-phosphate acyltransferase [Planctomycetales bacterium]|nr:1-acyl-sn-glycerol-3-phosphate acyltransferase [Planctomycetales bacterium]
MQDIIVEKPYRFLPPHRGTWIPNLVQKLHIHDKYLAKFEGVESHEVRGAGLLRESLRQGHGVILAPNHCRYADPLAMGWIARQVHSLVYAMASWHLFHQSRLQGWAIRMLGGFSVYREGLDRDALETAIDILARAERPLIIFPEGTVFRSNDILQPLLDGVAFIARTAAKRRVKHNQGAVVIHPVAIKYLFQGNLESTLEPVLTRIETRLTFSPDVRDLIPRIERIGLTLLVLKEIEYLGTPQTGCLEERQQRLIEHLMHPLEAKWLAGQKPASELIPRVKSLRTQIVPQLLRAAVDSQLKRELWVDLHHIYLAQQIGSYPHDYLHRPTITRLLETVERYEEDLTDRCTIHRPLHAILEILPAIEVDTGRPPRGAVDPIMSALEGALAEKLEQLSAESPLYEKSLSLR